MRCYESRCRIAYQFLKKLCNRLDVFIIEAGDDWVGYSEILPQGLNRVIIVQCMKDEPWSEKLMVLAHEFCHHVRWTKNNWVLRSKLSNETSANHNQTRLTKGLITCVQT